MDKFYQHIKDPDLLNKAGWFDDGLTQKQRKSLYATNIFTTPIHKLETKARPVVLITTGGFSPLHEGHLNMMEEAKKTLSEAGYGVCGGYFSPSHDSYVLQKQNTNPLDLRVKSIEDQIFTSPWLMTDLWEAMYTPTAINFTDVILRLEEYLKKWFHQDVEVVYVFGSDNQGFLEAFRFQGKAVCVQRGGSLTDQNQDLIDNKRLFFVNSSKYENFKSREINYQKGDSTGSFLIRDDLKKSLNYDSKEALDIFNKYFSDIKVIPAEYPLEFKEKVISLDTWYKGDYQLKMSRNFSLADFNYKGIDLSNRICSSRLEHQLELIPKGEYLLVDDDIASGQTINFVKNLLEEQGVKIKGEKSLAHEFLGVSEFRDVVDLRDFFFGAKEGGLTIVLPNGKRSRVPYITPFVNLYSRASLDYKSALRFSLEVLELNKKYLADKKIKDLPFEQRELFNFLRINQEKKVVDFIEEIKIFLEGINN